MLDELGRVQPSRGCQSRSRNGASLALTVASSFGSQQPLTKVRSCDAAHAIRQTLLIRQGPGSFFIKCDLTSTAVDRAPMARRQCGEHATRSQGIDLRSTKRVELAHAHHRL